MSLRIRDFFLKNKKSKKNRIIITFHGIMKVVKKMIINVKKLNINYIQYGSGKDIVLLHGWGQNIEMMKPIGDLFQDQFRITILDLPGFGKSEEPKEAWNIEKYSLFLEEFLKKVEVKKPIMIGHSFGGRVAIRYSSRNTIEKLILFGSPCIRIQEELPLYVKILKGLKKLPGMNQFGEYMKKYIGSRDYKAASKVMRETLVQVVNEDLSKFAREIEEPTLLIWGENDTEAPVKDAKELEKIMIDAGLIILPGTHYAYLENLQQVGNILNSFLKEEK